MIELSGKYSNAKIFSNNVEEKAKLQIIELLNQDFTKNSKIRIMPDVHMGSGCVIGFTANLGEKIIPNLVGVDIGCGVLCINLGKITIDLEKTDDIIHNFIPSGRNIHTKPVMQLEQLNNLNCIQELKDGIKYNSPSRFNCAIGSLGSGNHMIELDKDNEGNFYLVIHSGSRNLGKQVADYYQNLAFESCKGLGDLNTSKQNLIKQLKLQGKKDQIQKSLRALEKKHADAQPQYPKDLCFLENESRENYLHDMRICQEYAVLNRETMANIILDKLLGLTIKDFDTFCSIHNYIDFKDNIIRKGAVSAYAGEKLIIPINMRDGSIIAVGKGNEDWNNSAPHGAGRLMGRNEAKRTLSIDEFTESMQGIYTTTANLSTLDEAPLAYKPMQEIIDNIQDTVTIEKIIKPIYNYKSAE